MGSIPIATLFIGIFVLLQIPLTILVGYRRARTGIQFFDGGDPVLLRRMRAHGNYTETVPIALLAMAAAELSGAPAWLLWAGGSSLLVGRVMHAAILIVKGWGLPRAIGMILTFLPMLGFGLWCLSRAASSA
ncbi:MAG: MAPEG family protein [Deltaproteobacteria bacterium]|nr:MAPEG family protein [Deltaproteobacteria bacterium]